MAARGSAGFARIVAVALGSWPLEALHYAVLLHHYQAAQGGLASVYLRVLVFALHLAVLRVLLYTGGIWFSGWLFGLRVNGREALLAASTTSPAVAVVLAALTPLALQADTEPVHFLTVAYYASHTAAALAAAAALADRARGERGGYVKLAATVLAAVILVANTPAAFATPQAFIYQLIASALGLAAS